MSPCESNQSDRHNQTVCARLNQREQRGDLSLTSQHLCAWRGPWLWVLVGQDWVPGAVAGWVVLDT